MNPFVKSLPASADVVGGRIVKFSDAAASSKVAQATASTDPLAGVADLMGAKSGGMVDVTIAGLSPVRAGGNISAGDYITADANGKAIKCVPAAGEVRQYVGKALVPAVLDDIFDAWIAPGVISHPAAE